MLKAAANFRRLDAQPEHGGNSAVYHARQRLFQSLNHRYCLILSPSACLLPLL
jgi:hypothetical protein